jgi:hypothetical protein
MRENKLLERVEEVFKWGITKTDSDFCRWDAENEDYIVELKCRRTHYNTQIIEYGKFDALVDEANKIGKEVMYIAATPEIILVFEITKLCAEGYNFNWENKSLPSHTDFGKASWQMKKVGYIDNNKSMWRIPL